MTLQQLNSLNEDEIAIILFIVNKISPPCCPKMEFEAKHLTWFKHKELLDKIAAAFPQLHPDSHSLFVSLMNKLGAQVQIQKSEPPTLPPDQPITGSIETPLSGSPDNTTTGSI